MAVAEAIEIAGVRVTSPDKVLYPDQGVTKRELAEYYLAVAERMLPHVADRPLTLVRCPAGQESKCFYQRHAGSGVPDALHEVDIPGFEESGAYLYLSDVGGLIALVQMGVLEIHPWGARIDRPDRPDRVIFDLDPGEGLGFADVAEAAREVRTFLEKLGLRSFLKATGGKGLHVVLPIERRHDWAEAKRFAKTVAEGLAGATPEKYLTRVSKAARRGKIFIDYLRNDPTATAIAPYSSRARPGATVAMPLAWDDLRKGLDPAAFTVETAPDHIRKTPDPWADFFDVRQGLPKNPD